MTDKKRQQMLTAMRHVDRSLVDALNVAKNPLSVHLAKDHLKRARALLKAAIEKAEVDDE